jgi:hypothetical protein
VQASFHHLSQQLAVRVVVPHGQAAVENNDRVKPPGEATGKPAAQQVPVEWYAGNVVLFQYINIIIAAGKNLCGG